METKRNIIDTKLVPYFGKRKISEITSADIMHWQNEMLAIRDENDIPYSSGCLKTIHNQLSAIFNHTVRFYGLHNNPATITGNMGKEKTGEVLIWTKEEYQQFVTALKDRPVSYMAFETLYWCGLRLGELLALTPADFDFGNKIIHITKSYQRIKGEDVITHPKQIKAFAVC